MLNDILQAHTKATGNLCWPPASQQLGGKQVIVYESPYWFNMEKGSTAKHSMP